MKKMRETQVIAIAIALLAITGNLRDINASSINVSESNSQYVETQDFLALDSFPLSIIKTNNEDDLIKKINDQDIDKTFFNNSTKDIMSLIEENEKIKKEEEEKKEKEEEAALEQNTTEAITKEENPRPYTDDEQLLATVIHAEAGICDEHEKLLVGSVILNRVDSTHFPNTISDVIYQKGQFVSVNGRVWREEVPDESEYQIARKLIEGYRECPQNVVWFSKRCDFGTQYTKTKWHEYGAE